MATSPVTITTDLPAPGRSTTHQPPNFACQEDRRVPTLPCHPGMPGRYRANVQG